MGPNPTISGNGAESGATVTVREGTTTVCSATAGSAGAWSCASTLAMGTHAITATQVDVAGNTSPASASVSFVVFDGGTQARLGNISARMQVLTGNDVLIGGFVIGGSTPKTVVVRARGPSLAAFGITSFLTNPQLQLVRSSDQATLATNDDWQSASNAADVTASGFAPSDSLEAAILVTLPPGAYTAIVSGMGNATGVGIVEVFEVDAPAVPLTNLSARGFAQGGADVMIAGFVIQGTSSQTVLVRARGPSLVPFGIMNPLPNPRLRLVRSSDQAEIHVNDDWRQASNQLAITASGYAPGHDLEAAVLVSLPPGAYTAVVDGGIGVAIVEVFRIN